MRNRDLEIFLLTNYEWDFLSDEDWDNIPIQNEERYIGNIIGPAMKAFSINLFRKKCSQIGVRYEEVESVFLKQNKEFFYSIRKISRKGAFFSDKIKGSKLINICESLIVPKIPDEEILINQIKRLNPEKQAEVLQLLAGKKIKITVEDI